MTATEARALTTSKLNGPVIKPLLDHVLVRIQEAAANGRFELNHPFHGWHAQSWPSVDQQEAVWLALQNLGYKVDHMPDPDPGHPASGPYDRISWK